MVFANRPKCGPDSQTNGVSLIVMVVMAEVGSF